MGTSWYTWHVRIISRKTLRRFWEQPGHKDAEQPLRAWFAEAKKTQWKKPADIKRQYRSASFVGKDRVVFNIAGNKYRLIVAFKYAFGTGFIRFVGTHSQYDRIDVEKV